MIIHDVEQGSPEWHALRAGLATGSEFSKLVTTSGTMSGSLKTYALTLAAEKYAGKAIDPWTGNYWTQRGKELEPEAAQAYGLIKDVEPEVVGFVTDDRITAGVSPDRFIGANGVLEIKCLKAESHVSVLISYNRSGKVPSDYIAQTQGQLYICEREWSDLFFYHPDLPPLIVPQVRDEKFISALKHQIAVVNAERDKALAILKAA